MNSGKVSNALRAVEIVIEGVLVGALITGGVLAFDAVRSHPEPTAAAEVPDGQLLRRLEIRLKEPLDKGRGDRYRMFECYEVNRERPTAATGDVAPGGAVRTPGTGQGAAGR